VPNKTPQATPKSGAPELTRYARDQDQKPFVMKNIARLGILFLAVILALSSFAQTSPTSTTKVPVPPSIAPQPASVDRYGKLLDRLILERQSLVDESKRQFEVVKYLFEQEQNSFQNLMEKALWILGGLLTLAASATSYILIKIAGEQRSVREKFGSVMFSVGMESGPNARSVRLEHSQPT